MRKSRFSETADHCVAARAGGRRDHGGRLPAAHGVSEQTFYRWKAKCDGMGGEPLSAIGPRRMASEATRLKCLEDENRRLVMLLGEAMLDGEPLCAYGQRCVV